MGRSLLIPASLKFDLEVPALSTEEYAVGLIGEVNYAKFLVFCEIATIGKKSFEVTLMETDSDVYDTITHRLGELFDFSTNVVRDVSEIKLVFQNGESIKADLSIIQLI